MPPLATSSAQSSLSRCVAWHLRLDKFSGDLSDRFEAPPKTSALRNVVSCYDDKSRRQLSPVVKTKLAWLDRIADQATPARYRCVRLIADSKLLVGLGRSHVLENVGIAFERTTGLPLIPGSAVKGLVSTWAAWSAAGEGLFQSPPVIPVHRATFATEDTALARAILGDNTETGSVHSGEVVFLGGYPETPPIMGLDIVNPHHEADGSDKRNLTPNTFLCLEPGTPATIWRFPLLVRPGAADSERLLQTAGDWLIEALTQIGIGAKTAAGYGRFRLPIGSAAPAGSASGAAVSDFTEKSFAAVIERMNNAGMSELFQKDLKMLLLPQNAVWLEKLKAHLVLPESKATRKRLKDKSWFPRQLLPQS